MENTINDMPPMAEQLTERCVAHVLSRFGFELDYTEETLGVVDQAIDAVLLEEGEHTRLPPAHERRTHLVQLLASSYGVYFGEVLRRTYACHWHMPSEDPAQWTIEFEEVFLRINPVCAAAEALLGAPIDGFTPVLSTAPNDAEVLAERLDASPPVFEDQFYTLTTRVDVIQISLDYLRERQKTGKNPVPSYTHEDYEHIFAEENA